MEDYLQEKSEIAMHILQGEWEAAHEKVSGLLQKEPENIELRELIAQAYFGLKDYSSAGAELDKMWQTLGHLPDSIKRFAVKNENMLNGADAALRMAGQLDAEFGDRTSNEFYEFKLFEAQICFHEITTIANGLDFPEKLQVSKAQKMAGYLLRLVNSFEDIDESHMDRNSKAAFDLGKQWLLEVFAVLYRGDCKNGFEMEINHHYPAAKECILVLEKLADMGNGFAQKTLGDIYSAAYNVERDDGKAFDYYKQAYENGENTALVSLALYYDEGTVVEKDTNTALEYAKKAVEAGVKKADTVLGQIYADSLGDVEQGLVWLKKGYAAGDMVAKNILLRLARENVDNFDDKLRFILDIHKELESNIDALGAEPVSDLGRKYARYYMEIEKYYIAPMDRLKFINVCLNVQVDLVTAPGGVVSGDFFVDQFEKLVMENREIASKIAKERGMASRISNLALAEMVDLAAKGNLNHVNELNWSKIKNYYFPKALELGWDGYYADGTGPWKPDSSGNPNKGVAAASQPTKTGFAAMDSYDRVPTSKSSSGGCYIATAVYGSYDCPEVWVLRRFRDHSLARSVQGRLFIRLYYTVSPVFVRFFGNTAWFRRFWKGKLDKVVQELRKKGYMDTPYFD